MRYLLAILLFGVLAAPAVAADAVPGKAAPFAGRWAVAFPEGEGVIVNKPDATCDAPVVIAVAHDHFITYASPGGEAVEFEVMSFDGRNPWWTKDGRSMVAEWKDDDRFWLAATDMGKADWKQAKEYKRCPD
jgi:hypothetical protein